MTSTNLKLNCPFKGCSTTYISTNHLREHLTTAHEDSLHKIKDEWWNTSTLHPCKTCYCKKIFINPGYLKRHIQNHHTSKIESKDNIDLLKEHIPPPPSSNTEWDKSLPWLHNLKITPPPFRQNIWHKTNSNIKNKIKYTYHQLIKIITISTKEPTDRPHIPHLHKRDILWKLGIIFESLILFPINKEMKEHTSQQIKQRLLLFHTGKIIELYDQSRQVTSLTPQQKRDMANKMPTQQIQKNTQLAANLDNYKTALDPLTQDTPIALNTNTNVNILKRLLKKNTT